MFYSLTAGGRSKGNLIIPGVTQGTKDAISVGPKKDFLFDALNTHPPKINVLQTTKITELSLLFLPLIGFLPKVDNNQTESKYTLYYGQLVSGLSPQSCLYFQGFQWMIDRILN